MTFLGKAPAAITRDNVQIDGGRRVTGIHVVEDPELLPAGDSEGDDRMVVRVDKEGDFSTYTLRMVEQGSPHMHLQAVLAAQQAHMQRLQDELQEFIRKLDYRFGREPYGREADAWQRVVALYVGVRGAHR